MGFFNRKRRVTVAQFGDYLAGDLVKCYHDFASTWPGMLHSREKEDIAMPTARRESLIFQMYCFSRAVEKYVDSRTMSDAINDHVHFRVMQGLFPSPADQFAFTDLTQQRYREITAIMASNEELEEKGRALGKHASQVILGEFYLPFAHAHAVGDLELMAMLFAHIRNMVAGAEIIK